MILNQKKINLNKIIEFGDTLMEHGDKSNSDKFEDLYKKYVEFYKTYYNCDKETIEMFIKINKEQNYKDLLLQQEELMKNLKFEQKMLLNKNIFK